MFLFPPHLISLVIFFGRAAYAFHAAHPPDRRLQIGMFEGEYIGYLNVERT